MNYEIIKTSPENFSKQALLCSNRGQNKLLAMFAAHEQARDCEFAIYAVFQNPAFFAVPLRILKAEFPTDVYEYPSLTPDIPAAGWYEREIHDMFGLVARNHPDLRPLVLHENYPTNIYPLRKSFARDSRLPIERNTVAYPQMGGEGVFEVPVGPIHAGIIEPGHFIFSQVGETVLNLEAKLFFTHRGIEKAVEGLTPEKALFMVERICGACAVSHAISFCQAIESMSEVEVPKTAQAIRVLLAELERLYNHVGDIGNISAGLAFAPVISGGARLKELLMRANEMLTGNRFLRNSVILGGVRVNIKQNKILELLELLSKVESELLQITGSMYNQQEFVDRVATTGTVPQQTALKMVFSGIAARATGIDTDTRRDFPYLLYPQLDFRVITEHSGDVDARIRVRIGEVSESIKIIRQATELILTSDKTELCVELGELQTATLSIGMSESARGNNLHAVILDEHGCIERMFVRSASYSNWPALPVAAPGNIIPDFPLINKSFELCYACLDR